MCDTNLLIIDIITSDAMPIIPGESKELKVIITNNNPEDLKSVKVYFDDLPNIISSWYQVIYYHLSYSTIKRTYEQFNLASGQSHEVVFRWQVPIYALYGNYSYNLVIDSEEFINPIISRQQLNISITEGTPSTPEPTFYLELPNKSSNNGKVAISSSLEPLELNLQLLSTSIQVIVENRTERVDNFRLECEDISKQWFTIQYPYGDDKLNLLPTRNGQITLLLHPPVNAEEGIYSPTIQIKSANNDVLFIADILYFKIPNRDNFIAHIEPPILMMKNQPVSYNLTLTNEGNTQRKISLELDEQLKNKWFQYNLSSLNIELEQEEKKKLNWK